MERIYNIPLRKGYSTVPLYKRAKKAINTLKLFMIRHMKCSDDQLKLGKKLNEKIWEKGIKNPPHHVKVTAIKDDEGIVKVELFGFKYEEPVKEEGKEEPKKEEKAPEVKEEKPKAEKKPVTKKTTEKKAPAKKTTAKKKKIETKVSKKPAKKTSKN